MYHYISNYPNSIAVSPALFEEHCKGMADEGWRGISLAEAESFLHDGKPLPKKSVLITFDDGFLDNYVYALPILRKYGHKGVIFATTAKLEAAKGLRPSLQDVWDGTMSREELPRVDAPFTPHPLGFDERHDLFLNWDEARAAEASGVMAVAAHSLWHSNIFTSPDFQGFFIPRRRERTFDRVASHVPWGLPRFTVGPSLQARAFLPSTELVEGICEIVPQNKAEAFAFFSLPDNAQRVANFVSSLGKEGLGRYETDEEQYERLHQDFSQCKAMLEQELGHSVTAFCWPWGAFSKKAFSLGQELGFQTFFTTAMGANPAGQPSRVNRFKAKSKPWSWLRLRLQIYSTPWSAKLYAKIRL